jgi:hypothetical protein
MEKKNKDISGFKIKIEEYSFLTHRPGLTAIHHSITL